MPCYYEREADIWFINHRVESHLSLAANITAAEYWAMLIAAAPPIPFFSKCKVSLQISSQRKRRHRVALAVAFLPILRRHKTIAAGWKLLLAQYYAGGHEECHRLRSPFDSATLGGNLYYMRITSFGRYAIMCSLLDDASAII